MKSMATNSTHEGSVSTLGRTSLHVVHLGLSQEVVELT